jgi:hypothetical protein
MAAERANYSGRIEKEEHARGRETKSAMGGTKWMRGNHLRRRDAGDTISVLSPLEAKRHH